MPLERGEPIVSSSLNGAYDIVRVVDGDTILVDLGKAEERVRLIGIDTPESVHSEEEKNTAEGEIASQWLKEKLNGERIYLEYDSVKRDQYDRLLAYVYLSDGKTMVQRQLLENGFAKVDIVPPNRKYVDEFRELSKAAKEENKGFWKTGFFS